MDCIYNAIIKSVLPDSLKKAYITPVHKRNEPTDKENSRPVSVFPVLSKVFKRLNYDYDQLSEYLEKYINPFLLESSFHSTYHSW